MSIKIFFSRFNGQILLAHQCFYEFRESAAFIALIDWDDLLVPSSHFTSLPAAFARAAKRYPQAAYFKVNKLEASFEHQGPLVEKGSNPMGMVPEKCPRGMVP